MRVWLNRLLNGFLTKVCLFSEEAFGWVWWWSSSTCWIANYWLWNHKSIPRDDTTAAKPQVIWMSLFELQHYLCCFDQLQRRFFLLSKLKHDTREVIIKMEDFLWKPRYHSFLTWHLRFNHIFFGLCWVLVVLGVQCFDVSGKNVKVFNSRPWMEEGHRGGCCFFPNTSIFKLVKIRISPISFQFLLHKSHLQPPRFIVFYLRGCGHCRRTWEKNPGHLGEGEPPK